MGKRILKITPGSKAEQYFINTYMPVCKDKVICRLGKDFGWHWNEYEITEDDYFRCREFAMKKEGR